MAEGRGRIRGWWALPVLLAGLAISWGIRPQKPRQEDAAVPAPASGETAHAADDWVVGSIGDRQVTFGELERVIQSLPVHARVRYQSYDRRRDFLEAYLQVLALAAHAAEVGYGRDPDVVERLKAEAVERFLREREDLWVRSSDIPDEEVRRYYEAHPEEFHRPAQGRFLQVVVRDRQFGERVLLRLRAALEASAVDPVRTFRQQAERYRSGPDASGWDWDLGWRPTPEDAALPPSVREALGRMREDWTWEGPVESPLGFHVLFRAGSREAVDLTLAQARPAVLERLVAARQEALRRAFLEEVRRESGVTVHQEAADRVVEEARREWAERPRPEGESP